MPRWSAVATVCSLVARAGGGWQSAVFVFRHCLTVCHGRPLDVLSFCECHFDVGGCVGWVSTALEKAVLVSQRWCIQSIYEAGGP